MYGLRRRTARASAFRLSAQRQSEFHAGPIDVRNRAARARLDQRAQPSCGRRSTAKLRLSVAVLNENGGAPCDCERRIRPRLSPAACPGCSAAAGGAGAPAGSWPCSRKSCAGGRVCRFRAATNLFPRARGTLEQQYTKMPITVRPFS